MSKELAIDLLLTLLLQAEKVSAIIRAMKEEGRDELTKEELDVLRAADDAARANLVSALEGN